MRKDKVAECDDFIRRYILRGRRFVSSSCFPYGAISMLQMKEKSLASIDDFQYFAFTKSVKTLISIRKLLSLGNNEDAYILARSSFEAYLASRLISEKQSMDQIDKILKDLDVESRLEFIQKLFVRNKRKNRFYIR